MPENYDDFLISVIIPNFNRVDEFQKAVLSVLKQTYRRFELIVVDDCSDKDIREKNGIFLKELLSENNKVKIKYYENSKNKGVSYSRNIGIKNSEGQYIAFLDSDDIWLPQKLEIQVEYIKKTGFKVVHTEEIWIRNGVRVNQMLKHKKEGGDIFFRSLNLCLMSPSSIILKKTIFEQYGYFDENMLVCEDYDMWLRICKKEKVGFIEKPLIIKYGGHSDQLSRKYEAMDRYRVHSLIKLLKENDLTYLQRVEVKKTIVKKAKILYNGAIKREKFSDAKIYKSWIDNFQ